eukprot:TRINITY_DN9877_c0_g2_i3.p1 TRINITY_DN9877_c0_g2~~TRINITY_DN9877_c0_g2_i3.p1  ORF type:complete len:190 (+),score=33.43 TRINITY_DN9877_c0_g2_i3:619-1188(+)
MSTQTRCQTCNSVSERDEPFIDLSLDIENNKSLSFCLKNQSEPETLKDANQFHCDKCRGKQDAEKRVLIKFSPQTLIIHLKRFKYDETLRRMVKLNHRVAFTFDIRLPNHVEKDKPPVYKHYSLFAIVIHFGPGILYGHYIALIKNRDKWYKFDDDEITLFDEKNITYFFGNFYPNACAYMLFYREESR